MGIKLKQALQIGLRTKLIIVAATTGTGLIVAMFFFGYFNTALPQKANANPVETIGTGSYIINMGIVPQTIGNGLRPYGLIYDLNTVYNVPVKWIIEPTKIKDGTDFIHNGVIYKGGTFIIPVEYITTTVANRITYWNTLGVTGNYSVSPISIPVYSTITTFPRVMIDNLSGNDTIIANYFVNASIPAASYEINSPANLSICHDIWINPHGDPTWATHYYLYNFVTVQKSYIWMQCHAVSMMEYCTQPVTPFTKLNYLSTSGLKCWGAAKCGTNPESHPKSLPGVVNYFYPTDPVMQFMGTLASITSTGSEKWYVPVTAGGWRTNTKRLATTGTFPSPNEGVILVYGPAFGDTSNGKVMYTGGHDMNAATATEKVAGQRSFFNFLHLAGKSKAPNLNASVNAAINANATDTFSVSVTGGTAPYTYSWINTDGGTFSAPNDSVTLYTAFHTMTPWQTIITCVVTDACGRRNFISMPMNVNASALPVSLIDFSGKYDDYGNILLTWKTATEINNNYFTISKSTDGINFTKWKNVSSKGNGNSIQTYRLIDTKLFSAISYYRLNQTDYDGTNSEISTIKIQAKNFLHHDQVTVGPNPFTNKITITLPKKYEGETQLKIYNTSGKMVYEQAASVMEENQQIIIESLNILPKGNYILKIYNGPRISKGISLIKN